jgi:hypothetical protein
MDFFKALNLYNTVEANRDQYFNADTDTYTFVLYDTDEIKFLHYCLFEDPTLQTFLKIQHFKHFLKNVMG